MPTDPNEERQRFRAFARSHDPKLRAELIEDHLWLARHGARRFGNKGESSEDLLQVASLALVKAVDRFDPEHGVRFATYAMPTIVGELRRHFRDKTWSMRVPRRIKDLHVELRTLTDDLRHQLGRAPTVDELAEASDSTPEDVLEALEAGASYRAASLDAPRLDLESDNGAIPAVDDHRLERAAEHVGLQEALRALPERDRQVVYLRFFKDLTQSEIAQHVGVSQVHVSRILRASLSTLEGILAEPPEVDDVRQLIAS